MRKCLNDPYNLNCSYILYNYVFFANGICNLTMLKCTTENKTVKVEIKKQNRFVVILTYNEIHSLMRKRSKRSAHFCLHRK